MPFLSQQHGLSLVEIRQIAQKYLRVSSRFPQGSKKKDKRTSTTGTKERTPTSHLRTISEGINFTLIMCRLIFFSTLPKILEYSRWRTRVLSLKYWSTLAGVLAIPRFTTGTYESTQTYRLRAFRHH